MPRGAAPAREAGERPRPVCESCPPHAEEPRRSEQENEKEDDEADGVLVGDGDVDGAQRLHEPQQDPARNGARDGSEPAEHHDDEALGDEELAYRGIEIKGWGEEHASGARERAAEAEGEHGDAVDVDPHEGGRLRILAGGADGAAGIRPREEEIEADGDDDGEEEGDGERNRDGDPEGTQRSERVAELDRPVVAGPREEGHVGDQEREPRRVEQGVELAAGDDRLEQEAIDEHAGQEHHGHPQHDGDEWIDAEERVRPEGAEHAEHDQIAVGEVDDAHDAEDYGEPYADHGVKRAGQDAADDALDEGFHSAECLEQVPTLTPALSLPRREREPQNPLSPWGERAGVRASAGLTASPCCRGRRSWSRRWPWARRSGACRPTTARARSARASRCSGSCTDRRAAPPSS